MNARDFLLTTDYPFDKVVRNHTGNFSAAASFGAFQPRRTEFTMPHDFGSWGLIVGAFSVNNVDWLPFGVTNADTSGAIPTFQTVEVNAYCTTTNIVVQASNWLGSSQTVYFALQLISRT